MEEITVKLTRDELVVLAQLCGDTPTRSGCWPLLVKLDKYIRDHDETQKAQEIAGSQ